MAYDIAFQAKVIPLLDEVFDTYLAQVWNGRLYKQVRPLNSVLPAGVYQNQDGGGRNDDKLQTNGWTGLVVFRSISKNDADNWVKIQALLSALPNIAHASYDIASKPDTPMPFPVDRTSDGNIYTAGVIVRFWIHKKENT